MIIRVVKMEFRPDEVAAFRELFFERQHLIRGFEGCRHLELWQEASRPTVFFTYSHWDTPEHLDAYRQSPFFEATWMLTKQKFAARPEAWTVQAVPG